MAGQITDRRPRRDDEPSWWRAPVSPEVIDAGSEPAPHLTTPERNDPMNGSALTRFLGGSPTSVFLRLLFVSLIVGAFLMWLDIRPSEVLYAVERLLWRVWNLGFGAIREVAEYILAGAVLVVPVWLVIRLLSMRGTR
jgi:hypothetical protein